MQRDEELTRQGVQALGAHADRVGERAALTSNIRATAEVTLHQEYHERARQIVTLKQSTAAAMTALMESNARVARQRAQQALAEAPEREAILDAGGNPDGVFRARAVLAGFEKRTKALKMQYRVNEVGLADKVIKDTVRAGRNAGCPLPVRGCHTTYVAMSIS